MTEVSEHQAEHEWECYNVKWSWVDFFVVGHTIRIDNLLEWPCEIVGLDEGRRHDTLNLNLLKLRTSYASVCPNALDAVEKLGFWVLAPDESLVEGILAL